jgi:hypothetical protein
MLVKLFRAFVVVATIAGPTLLFTPSALAYGSGDCTAFASTPFFNSAGRLVGSFEESCAHQHDVMDLEVELQRYNHTLGQWETNEGPVYNNNCGSPVTNCTDTVRKNCPFTGEFRTHGYANVFDNGSLNFTQIDNSPGINASC